MIYLNLKTSLLRAPEYIGSEPTGRATWLNLLCYCAEQENGGVIPDCAAWKDRQWQQTCGVTLAEVREECCLWEWRGDDLAVAFYPADKQAEVQAKREAGRRGGKRSGKARREAVREAQLEAVGEAELEAQLQGQLERKGKERKVKEKEVGKNVAAVAATSDEDWLAELAKNPAYVGLNINVEANKMRAWCSANGKQPTRRRFVNWLNRAERPIAASIRPAETRKPLSAWELRQAIEAAEKEASRLKGDPNNTEPINGDTPWERRMKPEVAARVKELKARAQELNGKLALLGREAA